MTPIIWSPLAADDIVGIQTYISADSVQYAELVVRRIVARVEQLSTFPESGRVVPERQDVAIREVIVKPYRVVYRFQGSAIEIVTVFRFRSCSGIRTSRRQWSTHMCSTGVDWVFGVQWTGSDVWRYARVLARNVWPAPGGYGGLTLVALQVGAIWLASSIDVGRRRGAANAGRRV